MHSGHGIEIMGKLPPMPVANCNGYDLIATGRSLKDFRVVESSRV